MLVGRYITFIVINFHQFSPSINVNNAHLKEISQGAVGYGEALPYFE
jgi:hypothetical protein